MSPARRALAVLVALAGLWPAPAHADPFGRRVREVAFTGAPQEARRLTQLPVQAGRPLSREALQRSVRLLHRSGRFSRVLAWVEEQGDGEVSVRFEVEPLQHVARVSFNGLKALDEAALLKAIDLPAGTEFSPDRIDRAAADVAAAYFRAGWRDAFVRWDAVPSGAELAVDLSISEGSPTTLVKLSFEGHPGLTEPELQAAFDLAPGDRLALERVDQGLQELRERLRGRAFYRARVLPPRIEAADGRAVVSVPVEAGPRFEFQIRGAVTFTEAELLPRLRYAGEEPLERPVQKSLAERLRAFYEWAGFPDAKVVVRESRPPASRPGPDERLVSFVVREGGRRRVVSRDYPGLRAFTQEELDARIDATLEDSAPHDLVDGPSEAVLQAAHLTGAPGSPARDPWRVRPREIFATAAYRNACSQIRDLYRGAGYLDARVGPARLVPGNDDTATVVIPIDEGPQVRVERLRLEGAAQLPLERLQALVTLPDGAPLNYAAVEESRQAIANLYQAEGFAYVDVQDEEELDGTKAAVTLRITEGPRVKVSRIELKGLGRTDPALVRDALSIREGAVFTPQARQDSVRNLMRLGIFAAARVEPVDAATVEADKALVVEVREKPGFNAELRGGASYADGPRAAAQVAWSNLRGRNWTASIAAKLNWPIFRYCLVEEPDNCTSAAIPDVPFERRLNASLVVPQLQGAGQTPFDVRLDAVHESLLRPSYRLSKVAGLVSADGLWRRRLFGLVDSSLILQGELERDEFARRRFQPLFQTLADRKALLLPEGTILLASLRPALTFDARDDAMSPSRGVLVGLSLDFAKALSAVDLDSRPFDIAMIRSLLNISGYVPIDPSRRAVLAISLKAGRVFKREDSLVIGTKRLFLGGNQSLRGFSEDGVYPQDLRERLHEALARCRALATGLGCDDAARRLAAGSVDPSPGGEVSLLGRTELRVGLGSALDGALFLDAGNLWSDAAAVDLAKLRLTAGAGVRYLLPIGPAAFDVGFNLSRDAAFAEPPFRIHLAIGLF